MRDPVMTERHLAERWQISLKTLRRRLLDGEGPVWHQLFRHVRYHEADLLKFERRGVQHLMTLLCRRRFESKPPGVWLNFRSAPTTPENAAM